MERQIQQNCWWNIILSCVTIEVCNDANALQESCLQHCLQRLFLQYKDGIFLVNFIAIQHWLCKLECTDCSSHHLSCVRKMKQCVWAWALSKMCVFHVQCVRFESSESSSVHCYPFQVGDNHSAWRHAVGQEGQVTLFHYWRWLTKTWLCACTFLSMCSTWFWEGLTSF